MSDLARVSPADTQIWGSKDVTSANLHAAVETGAKYLLGFHEPELASGADLPVQVCSLLHSQGLASFCCMLGMPLNNTLIACACADRHRPVATAAGCEPDTGQSSSDLWG